MRSGLELFAHQLAGLMVTAARAETPEQLAAVYDALAETLEATFDLLIHDAAKSADLLADLQRRAQRNSAVTW